MQEIRFHLLTGRDARAFSRSFRQDSNTEVHRSRWREVMRCLTLPPNFALLSFSPYLFEASSSFDSTSLATLNNGQVSHGVAGRALTNFRNISRESRSFAIIWVSSFGIFFKLGALSITRIKSAAASIDFRGQTVFWVGVSGHCSLIDDSFTFRMAAVAVVVDVTPSEMVIWVDCTALYDAEGELDIGAGWLVAAE